MTSLIIIAVSYVFILKAIRSGAMFTLILLGMAVYMLAPVADAPAVDAPVVDTAALTKVEAHAWYDHESSTLYVDDAWDRTALSVADDMASLYDADFEAKYAEAVREVTSDEEFAAWQAKREAERDVLFTFVNGNGRIRYAVRHVVDVSTGDVIR